MARRKRIDGLIRVVQQRLLREALTGDVFLFVGGDPSQLKILCWDRDGLWMRQALATKRLSQGRFQVPREICSNVDETPLPTLDGKRTLWGWVGGNQPRSIAAWRTHSGRGK